MWGFDLEFEAGARVSGRVHSIIGFQNEGPVSRRPRIDSGSDPEATATLTESWGICNRVLPGCDAGAGNQPKSTYRRLRRGPKLQPKVRRFEPHLWLQIWTSPELLVGRFVADFRFRASHHRDSVSVAVASLKSSIFGWCQAKLGTQGALGIDKARICGP